MSLIVVLMTFSLANALTIDEQQFNSLRSLVEQQSKTIEELKLKVNQLEISQLQETSTFNQHKQTQPLRGRRTAPETSVAFTARLDTRPQHLAIDQTVIFGTTLLNDGNAYNTHTGIFTVPREGLYMFYLAFGVGGGNEAAGLQIVVDGKQQVSAVAGVIQTNHDAQGGNMVLRHLQAGDSVWVNVFRWNSVHVFGGVGFTSFSGVLLFEY